MSECQYLIERTAQRGQVQDPKAGSKRARFAIFFEAKNQREPSVEPLFEDIGEINLTDIHWVIVGGESGPRARPMQPAWVEPIRQQCEEAGQIVANICCLFSFYSTVCRAVKYHNLTVSQNAEGRIAALKSDSKCSFTMCKLRLFARFFLALYPLIAL